MRLLFNVFSIFSYLENMDKNLIAKLHKLEHTKDQLLKELSHLSVEKLNESPAPEKWSIAQVVFHIYLAELRSFQYMEKKCSDWQAQPTATFSEKIRSLLLSVSLRLPIKYKAPRVVSEQIPETVDWAQLIADWADLRKNLHELLERIPSEAYKKQLLKHPIIGKINIPQAITFFQDHFDHHVPQIKKNPAFTATV